MRERAEDAPALGAELRPGPIDEERHLGEIVFVVDHADAARRRVHPGNARARRHVASPEPTKASAMSSASGFQRSEPGEARDARERAPPRGHERGGDREDEDAREQAASGGDDERNRRAREHVEEARHRVIVLVVVEHDEPLALAREERSQLGEQLLALAGRPEPEREHLRHRPRVPRADAKPVDSPPEAARHPVPERRGEHRLAAPPRADEREAGGAVASIVRARVAISAARPRRRGEGGSRRAGPRERANVAEGRARCSLVYGVFASSSRITRIGGEPNASRRSL